MKRFLTILTVLFALCANAQNEKADLYIKQYSELAIEEMVRTGVPASIKLAQGLLESQSGESNLVKKSNNHFGIKCKTEWTGSRTFHDDDEKGECFRVYPSAEASYKDHSDFLRTRAHYNFLFKLNPADSEAWAYGLKKAGYATSPAYPQSLLKVIRENQLDRFNQLAIERINGTAGTIETTIQPAIIPAPAKAPVAEKTEEEKEEPETVEQAEPVPEKKQPIKKPAVYPEGTFSINQTKVIYAFEGISLLALANQYDITLSKLMEYNELMDVDILKNDQLLFLEKKQKKGAVDFHLVKEGESLYSIAQSEGVRLENILLYNNLTLNSIAVTGNKVFLKASNNIQTTANKK